MREKVRTVIFVLVLGSILTGALLGVDALTAGAIARNEERRLKLNVLDAFGIPHGDADIEALFDAQIEVRTIENKPFYWLQDQSVAFTFEGPGLWGPITGVMAVQPDLDTIRGITVIHQEETPGLGARIGERSFLDTFKAKVLSPALVITAAGKAASNHEVDGITGATLSCRAIEGILNREAGKYVLLIKRASP